MTEKEYQQKKASLIRQLQELEYQHPSTRRIGEEYYKIYSNETDDEQPVFDVVSVTDYGDIHSERDWDYGNYFNSDIAAREICGKLNKAINTIFKEVRKKRDDEHFDKI